MRFKKVNGGKIEQNQIMWILLENIRMQQNNQTFKGIDLAQNYNWFRPWYFKNKKLLTCLDGYSMLDVDV